MTADGELLRFGGQVIKNVAGFDVSRLLCGSLGILGVITEVSLKVLPLPRQEQTLRLELGIAEACAAFNHWAGQPLPLSAAAWHEGGAWLRLSGAAPAVHSACARLGGERIAPAAAQSWWAAVRHCTLPLFAEPQLWRLSLPGAAGDLPLPPPRLVDWGGALRWYAGNEAHDYRGVAAAVGGTGLCWRGAAPQGRFHPLSAANLGLHRRLKQRFDPRAIFNPNRLVRGL